MTKKPSSLQGKPSCLSRFLGGSEGLAVWYVTVGGVEYDLVDECTGRANAFQLESVFWKVFYEHAGEVPAAGRRAVSVAERVGLLLQYGSTWENSVCERPVTVRNSSFRYLDAFLPRLEDKCGHVCSRLGNIN